MKKVLLFISLLTFVSSLSAQNWLWGRQGLADEAGYLAADNNGNAFLSSYFGDSVVYGSYDLHSKKIDSYIIKYDSSGNLLWAVQSKGETSNSYCEVWGISADLQGNVFMTGSATDSVKFGSDSIQNPKGLAAAFLVKYDPSGNLVWLRNSLSHSEFSQAVGISVTTDKQGNSYMTGYFSDTIYFGTDTLITPYTFGPNIFLAKYDPNGNFLWAKQSIVPKHSYGHATCVSADSIGNAYVSGYYNDTLIFGAYLLKSIGGLNMFTVKYDPNGNVVWAKTTKGSPSAAFDPLSSATDLIGNTYITGYTTDTIYFGADTLRNSYVLQLFLVKYDSAGNALWAKSTTMKHQTWVGCAVAVDTTHKVYLAAASGGHFFSPEDTIIFDEDTITVNNTVEPSIIMELDSGGNMICNSMLRSGGDDNNGMACSPSGKFVYLGGDILDTITFNSNLLTPPPNSGEAPFVARWQPCAPGCPVITNIKQVGGICNPGDSTASAKVIAMGGVKPYRYFWGTIPTQTNAMATGLKAGTYTVTVKDDLGCTTTANITVTQPATALAIVATITKISCYDSINGKVMANVTGGTSPYTYLWSNGQTNQTATRLSTGTYFVTVTDTNGCIAKDTILVTRPLAISLSNTKIAPKCNGGSNGSIDVLPSGGTSPYSYLWSNSETAQIAINLTSGTYFVTITDSNGCKTKDTIILNQPTAISINSSSVNTPCPYDSGSATALASGGTGTFTYNWTPGGGTTAHISGLRAGTYKVIVTDSNGCNKTDSAVVKSLSINFDSVCCNATISYGQSINLTVISGAPGETYVWFPTQGLSCYTCPNPVASPTVSTEYQVTITDSLGCTITDYVFVNLNGECNVFVPNAFSPNGDGQNDILYVKGACLQNMDFIIYNRWGNKVFESESLNDGWDGTYKGKPEDTGTFVYDLKGTDVAGNSINLKGTVTLVR